MDLVKNTICLSTIILCFVACRQTPSEDSIFEEQWYLRTKDKSAFLFIKEIGEGEPVIVIHGGPGAGHQSLTDISAGLSQQFKFIFYDQRGFGLSSVSDSISMAKHIDDIESIREAYQLEKISLISHSFGTMMAMNYLETYPEKTKNIVMIGALDPKNGDAGFFTDEEMELFKSKNEEADAFYNRQEVKDLIAQHGLNKENRSPKEENTYWRIRQATANIYDVNNWKQLERIMIDNFSASRKTRETTNFKYDWSSMLAKHPFPITVINGFFDFEVGPKGSPVWKRVVASETPNVNLVLFDSASHHVWIDKPIEFRAALVKGLSPFDSL